jgi:hypothetical protein
VLPDPPDGAQLYVRVPVPPEAVTVALPLLLPHEVLVGLADAVMAEGCVMVTVCCMVHPLASVITQV